MVARALGDRSRASESQMCITAIVTPPMHDYFNWTPISDMIKPQQDGRFVFFPTCVGTCMTLVGLVSPDT